MKIYVLALAAAAALSVSAPAFAATATNGQQVAMSEHCRQVLGDSSKEGSKDYQYCQNNG
jgi:hypothetical protein